MNIQQVSKAALEKALAAKLEALLSSVEWLEIIRSWVTAGERVALTCFERLPQQCHRHCVAEALERLGGGVLPLRHL